MAALRSDAAPSEGEITSSCGITSLEKGDNIGNPQDSDANRRSEVDVPPDGGYGWVCVACNFWINAHIWGVNGVG